MKFNKIESSNIDAIAYENNELFVRFKNNTEYKYINVPSTIYEALMKSESKGRFLNEAIKKNYNYEKVNTKQILNEERL